MLTRTRDLPGPRVARAGDRWLAVPEPWRDWAVIAAASQAVLVATWLSSPTWPWLLLVGITLGLIWSTGTLIVLHDAGHRRFSRRLWVNAFAVQTAVPIGLWVGHWTLKHRVHHNRVQVYPLDEATRSSGLVRLHPQAPWRPVHRHQHLYAWFLYSLAWVGELRSQTTYLRTGQVGDVEAPGLAARAASFAAEKALWLLVLAPYAIGIGLGRLAIALVVAITVASFCAAVVTAVGHINVGVAPDAAGAASGGWVGHVARTTASFNTTSTAVRWVTGAMTHHLVHHLRPVAPRAALPALHIGALPATLGPSGARSVEFATFRDAVRGHRRRLQQLGCDRPEPAISELGATAWPAERPVVQALSGSAAV